MVFIVQNVPTHTTTNESAAIETGELIDLIGDPSEGEHGDVEIMLQVSRSGIAIAAFDAVLLAIIARQLDAEIPVAGSPVCINRQTGCGGFRVAGRQSGAEGGLP